MRKREKVKIGACREEILDRFGILTEEIRCRCGHKLMEVFKRNGSVVLLKCHKCGRIVKVEV